MDVIHEAPPPTPTPATDELLTTAEAAQLIKVHPDTLLKAVKRGRLQAFRTPGGQYRFQRADLLSRWGAPK